MSCLAALQCGVDNLPSPFRDRRNNDPRSEVPDRDRFQAIVPAYTFQCSGSVTEWRACVQPGGTSREQYYIQRRRRRRCQRKPDNWEPTTPTHRASTVTSRINIYLTNSDVY